MPDFAPFRHNIDSAEHARAFRVTAAPPPRPQPSVSVEGGRVRIDQTVFDYTVATFIDPLANGTNYVFIDNTGAITFNLGGPYPAQSIPLARVVVVAGDIVALLDDRCLFALDT